MATENCYWLICFVPIIGDSATSIFGFTEFLTAVVLLSVIYTVTDVRYKFRIAIAPKPLYSRTFILTTFIGFQTILTEVWVTSGWWVPKTSGWLTLSIWQGYFGLLLLCIFLTWMYYAFIRPPIYNKTNARRYARYLYRYILRGNSEELNVIANELTWSAKLLVKNSRNLQDKLAKSQVIDYAHDILLLIANRRFCRQIVSASPITAMVFFEEMVIENKFDIPIGTFVRNISSEAIAQKESFIYEEAEGYYSGLLGYLKPVSLAVYGNYQLVEALAKNNNSPFDLHYKEQREWDAEQWEAYCRAILITMKDYLEKRGVFHQSYALVRAIHDVETAHIGFYKLNNLPEVYNTDTYKIFRVSVEFVKDAIELIDKQKSSPEPNYQPEPYYQFNGQHTKNMYDILAASIFEICFTASQIKSPSDICWNIHYITVWSKFFGITSTTNVTKIMCFKVRRLLYNEIKEISAYPNYKNAAILGFCLNVLGLSSPSKQGIHREEYALTKAIHSWTRKGYLLMRQENPDVAKSVLFGRISFDETNNRLVKTFAKGLEKEAPKEYLDLDAPEPQNKTISED